MEIWSLGIALFSAAISGISIWVSIDTYKKTVEHDKKQDTIEAFNRLQNEVLDKIVLTKKEARNIAAVVGSDEYKTLSKYLARIEHFCVGVNAEIYDIDVLKRLAGKYFIGIFEKLSPLIEKKREINKTDKHYDEFERTVESLRRRYSNDEHKRS